MRRFWTVPEVNLVRESYGLQGGIDMLCKYLPHRTRGVIMQRGAKLGIRAYRQPRQRNRWPHDEHIDQAIRFVYQNNPQKAAIRALAEKLSRPRWWVSKRAAALGLAVPRYKEQPWSEREMAILESYHHRSLPVIARTLKKAGFRRTETAIAVKRKRLHLSAKNPDVYTATELGGLMGVDRGTVAHWVEKFGLTATRKKTARTEKQGGDPYEIKRSILRRWVGDNAARVDLRKVDRFWFIDLLMGNREVKEQAA